MIVNQPFRRMKYVITACLLIVACRSDSADDYQSLCGDFPSGSLAKSWTIEGIALSDSASTPLAGITVLDRSALAAFDRNRGQAFTFGATGRTLQTHGRPGRGPGDIAPIDQYAVLSYTSRRRDWLAALGDSLFVLDGNAIQIFRASDGRYLSTAKLPDIIARGVSLFPRETGRFRIVESTFVMDVSLIRATPGVSKKTDRRDFAIWRFDHDTVSKIFALALPMPPRTISGAIVFRINEARPRFDVIGGCVVAVDGGSPMLHVASLKGDSRETIPIKRALADPAENFEDAALLRSIHGPRDPLPEPSLPARIRGLIAAPDGWVWIEPVQPHDLYPRMEVIRIHIGTGVQRTDTVPFFPSAFGTNGTLFHIDIDSLGVARLYRAVPAAP